MFTFRLRKWRVPLKHPTQYYKGFQPHKDYSRQALRLQEPNHRAGPITEVNPQAAQVTRDLTIEVISWQHPVLTTPHQPTRQRFLTRKEGEVT